MDYGLVAGWVVWSVLLVLAVIWTVGLLTQRGVGSHMLTITIMWWLLIAWTLFMPINKLHLVWLAPLTVVAGVVTASSRSVFLTIILLVVLGYGLFHLTVTEQNFSEKLHSDSSSVDSSSNYTNLKSAGNWVFARGEYAWVATTESETDQNIWLSIIFGHDKCNKPGVSVVRTQIEARNTVDSDVAQIEYTVDNHPARSLSNYKVDVYSKEQQVEVIAIAPKGLVDEVKEGNMLSIKIDKPESIGFGRAGLIRVNLSSAKDAINGAQKGCLQDQLDKL
ncbi:MAG: hypothetical protein ABW088_00225 [Sedimenticola sp.]